MTVNFNKMPLASEGKTTIKPATSSATADAENKGKSDTGVSEETGKTASGDPKKGDPTQTETKYGETKRVDKALSKIKIGDVFRDIDAWDKKGAQPATTTEIASTNPQTTKQSLTGLSQFGEIPSSNRPDLAHDGVSPSELAHSSDAINQLYNIPSAQAFTAQQSSQPASGYSPLGQGGGGQQGGPTNLFVSSNSQSQAIAGGGSSNGGGSVTQVFEAAPEAPSTTESKPDYNPDSEDLEF